MRILRRRQQLSIPARITPGPEPILPQVAINRFKAQHLVLTTAIIPGEFYGRMVKLAVPGLRFLVRQISRDELKAQLIRTFMTGVEKTWCSKKPRSIASVIGRG